MSHDKDSSNEKKSLFVEFMDFFASMRTAVVLLVVIMLLTLVATFMKEADAQKYVYQQFYFHSLLALLGLSLLVCMVWRRRIKRGRITSLIMHAGILVTLIGSLVTLLTVRRSYVDLNLQSKPTLDGNTILFDEHMRLYVSKHSEILKKQNELDVAIDMLHNQASPSAEVIKAYKKKKIQLQQELESFEQSLQLGFTVKLIEAKMEHHQTPQFYVYASIPDESVPSGGKVEATAVALGRDVEIKGADITLLNLRASKPKRFPKKEKATKTHPKMLESKTKKLKREIQIMLPPDKSLLMPLAVNSELVIPGTEIKVKILRFMPHLVVDRTAKTSDKRFINMSNNPVNPAVEVLFTDKTGRTKKQWLFARHPSANQHEGMGKMGGMGGKMPKKDDADAEANALSGIRSIFVYETAKPVRPKNSRSKKKWPDDVDFYDWVEGDVELSMAGINMPVRLASKKDGPLVWIKHPVNPKIHLALSQQPTLKEYVSLVEVWENNKLVKTHRITVNTPLIHNSYKFSQSGFNEIDEDVYQTTLAVAVDRGAIFVYAGFLLMIIGIFGRFYLPSIKKNENSGYNK